MESSHLISSVGAAKGTDRSSVPFVFPMQLTLSRNSPTNSVYRNQDGTPLYRVETPFKLMGKISTVARFVSNPGIAHDERVAPVRSDNDSDTDIHLMRLEEKEVAQIHWHRFGKTLFKFGERTVSVGTYMPYTNLLAW